MINLIMFPISLILMLWLFRFDYIGKFRVLYTIFVSACTQVALLVTTTDVIWTVKLSLFLSLLSVAAYTDIKEEKILNINILLTYAAVVLGLVWDFATGMPIQKVLMILSTLLIVLAVSVFLTLIKGISTGDIPLILALTYLWHNNILVVIGISSVIFLLYSTPRMFYKLYKKKGNKFYVAAAPSFFIAAVILMFYNVFCSQFTKF